VGILVKNSLDFELLDRRNSLDENILLLSCRIRATDILLVCIYGPNNTDPAFFNTLNEFLTDFNALPVICGGDWNATFSTENVLENIDCLNMARSPNINHSKKIRDMCDNFQLTDPFRYRYPDRKEFTYVPRYALATNQSRIDFF
jgi:exonuclease III